MHGVAQELEWVKSLDTYGVAGQVAHRVQTLQERLSKLARGLFWQDNLVRATDRVPQLACALVFRPFQGISR